MSSTPARPPERSSQELLREITWADIVADGIMSFEELEARLKAKGYDPEDLMHLYE